jgi:hypothetical protein
MSVKKIWQRLTFPGFILVSSALVSLTSLFGMGRGGPYRYSHHKDLKNSLLTIIRKKTHNRKGLKF